MRRILSIVFKCQTGFDLLFRAFFSPREVRCLMRLYKRIFWVIGALAIIAIRTATGGFTVGRLAVLKVSAWVSVIATINTYFVGTCRPTKFQSSGSELERERMERGDNLSCVRTLAVGG